MSMIRQAKGKIWWGPQRTSCRAACRDATLIPGHDGPGVLKLNAPTIPHRVERLPSDQWLESPPLYGKQPPALARGRT